MKKVVCKKRRSHSAGCRAAAFAAAFVLLCALFAACGSKGAVSVTQSGGEGAPAVNSAAVAAQAPTDAGADAPSSAPPVHEPDVLKSYALPEGFVYVDDVIPDAVLEIRYATAHNFTASPIDGYDKPLAILTVQAAEALQKAAALAAQDGWRLHIYDAYRPQQALDCIAAWEQTQDTAGKAEFYPNMEKGALFTDGYLSKYSRHTRGSTVDLTLQRADTDELIDMGSPYDLLDALSNYGAAGLTPEQHANREMLRALMDEAGFDSIATEWWHFQLRGEPYPKTYFDFPVA